MDPPHPPHPPPHPNSSRNTPGTGRDSETTGTDQTDTNAAVPPAADRQPQCSGGYTVIPPNEFRRSKLIRMAQEEEEARQRWKETHRVPYVQPISERLGGDVTLAEARDKQLRDQQRSRVQKKMKQDELDKTRRQEEEAELQKKKDEQRRKAERLVAREHQDQQRRRQQLEPDYLRTSDRFLQSLERRAPDPRASSAASHTSSTGPSGRPAEFKGLPRVHGETKHDRAASERVRTTRTPEKAKSCRVNRERKFSWITRGRNTRSLLLLPFHISSASLFRPRDV
uniref:Epithelial stromal interaction 1 n=1 Tax=Scophthalmus maximus TaxID=52904 RepID=A0A8D3AIC4_SCOMX